MWGKHRLDPAVRHRHGQPDLLAAADRAAAAGGRPLVHRRAARTDRTRAALLVWGGWLLVTAVVFSFAQRHHPPVLHGGPGAGHRRRDRDRCHAAVAATATGSRPPWCCWRLSVLVAAGWQFELLDRTPSWLPWLRYAILMVGVASALLLVVVSRLARRAGLVIAAVALIAGAGRPDRVRDGHGPARAHRLDPERRSGRRGWLRPGRGGGARPAGAASAVHRPAGSAARPAARPAATRRHHRRRYRPGRLRRWRRPVACSTPAPRPRHWSALKANAVASTPGWPRRSAPTPRPATSWPASSR